MVERSMAVWQSQLTPRLCHKFSCCCCCCLGGCCCAGEGLITYMRTDGVNLSAEAVESLRGMIGGHFGAGYLPPAGSRVYKSRAKNAQEAHEAIRPTDPGLLPGQVQGLTPDQVRGVLLRFHSRAF